MSAALGRHLVALAVGLVFGAGLLVSGMTQPAKVLAFLDVTGSWDPSLMFVMASAIPVYAVVYRLALRRPRPLLSDAFVLPSRSGLDARLIGGAALFGIGWGLSGYCPGPAVVSLASGALDVVVFVAMTALGMWLAARCERPRARS